MTRFILNNPNRSQTQQKHWNQIKTVLRCTRLVVEMCVAWTDVHWNFYNTDQEQEVYPDGSNVCPNATLTQRWSDWIRTVEQFQFMFITKVEHVEHFEQQFNSIAETRCAVNLNDLLVDLYVLLYFPCSRSRTGCFTVQGKSLWHTRVLLHI